MRNTITITIDVGNDACAGDNLVPGVCWILDDIKRKLQASESRGTVIDAGSFSLHDINGVRVGDCDIDIDEDTNWDEAEAYTSSIHRGHCVEILEDLCGIQCYDHESVGELREAVFQNIKDGTVTFEDVKSHCGD